jgi:chromosome segregation ATPase
LTQTENIENRTALQDLREESSAREAQLLERVSQCEERLATATAELEAQKDAVPAAKAGLSTDMDESDPRRALVLRLEERLHERTTELQEERRERRRLAGYLEQILGELEEKAPQIESQTKQIKQWNQRYEQLATRHQTALLQVESFQNQVGREKQELSEVVCE